MRPITPPERVAAAASYLTMIPGVVFLFLPQYRDSHFVRFHAWQSIFLWGLFAVFTIVSLLLSNLAAAMFFLLFGILATLAMFFLWIVLTFKAWQGDRFELPILGAFAERMR